VYCTSKFFDGSSISLAANRAKQELSNPNTSLALPSIAQYSFVPHAPAFVAEVIISSHFCWLNYDNDRDQQLTNTTVESGQPRLTLTSALPALPTPLVSLALVLALLTLHHKTSTPTTKIMPRPFIQTQRIDYVIK